MSTRTSATIIEALSCRDINLPLFGLDPISRPRSQRMSTLHRVFEPLAHTRHRPPTSNFPVYTAAAAAAVFRRYAGCCAM